MTVVEMYFVSKEAKMREVGLYDDHESTRRKGKKGKKGGECDDET
jgi:hypothetical protein